MDTNIAVTTMTAATLAAAENPIIGTWPLAILQHGSLADGWKYALAGACVGLYQTKTTTTISIAGLYPFFPSSRPSCLLFSIHQTCFLLLPASRTTCPLFFFSTSSLFTQPINQPIVQKSNPNQIICSLKEERVHCCFCVCVCVCVVDTLG
ncbi:uncharacterized protein IWZ02DRAFT_192146 [Phyllosticta citriasiana]|uniref:uncharacterized protein n=1 Tax=Phyllosticta citriasiana TaxID=595635 RepID=UPI0030FD7B93